MPSDYTPAPLDRTAGDTVSTLVNGDPVEFGQPLFVIE